MAKVQNKTPVFEKENRPKRRRCKTSAIPTSSRSNRTHRGKESGSLRPACNDGGSCGVKKELVSVPGA
jgi:hypothetical protein